jgi:hypothetical protein
MADRATHPLGPKDEVRSHNALHTSRERRLALEVRSGRFGFAYFEGAQLLDWGARVHVDCETVARKMRSLISLYSPTVALARRARRLPGKPPCSATEALHTIRIELRHQSVTFVLLNRKRIREFFAQHSCRTKHEIASRLADSFPTLKSILPKPRRPWTPERHAMIIFDAVATDIAFNRDLPDPH